MTKFITVFASAMITFGVLSFVGVGLNIAADNISDGWVTSCWTHGWGFIWGGLVLMLLEEIRRLLAAPLDMGS